IPQRSSLLPVLSFKSEAREASAVKRREFITLLGSAAAWPLAARAQQSGVRRIGVLMNLAEKDLAGWRSVMLFRQELQRLGWVDGGNVRIDVRWTGGDAELYRKYAAELLAQAPDVVLA